MTARQRRNRWLLLLPSGVLLALVLLFGVSLGRDPSLVPSPLVGRPAPDFSLPTLLDEGATFSLTDIEDGAWMLNVWASWCAGCVVEHEFLMQLSRAGVPLYGLNWKDAGNDARQWLAERGNPYRAIGVDADGRAAIDWGVYGAPETFLIDADGTVLHRHVGPLDSAVFLQAFAPVLAGQAP
ncbi:DsbE family thiol:disulfide interchange protein [Candidatus Foliamicus sp.]